MMFIAAVVFLFLVAGPVYAQTAPPTTQPATKPAYAESKEGLTKLTQDILAASKANEKDKLAELIKGLRLPSHEAWFKKVFGDEKGAKLATEYSDSLKKFDEDMTKFFADIVKEGKSEVSVLVVKSADDKEATGLQKDALAAMKQKVTLYTAQMKKPGQEAGTTLWSFVYVDNGFRLAGKMRALK
jgi:hypothetical protein